MRIALVLDNVCSGLFDVPDGTRPAYLNDQRYQIVDSQYADLIKIGWVISNGVWSEPVDGRPTWADPELPEQYWWIYPGAFLDRMDVDGMAIAGSDHPVCKAAQGQFSNRLYIDLKSPKLATVLNALKLSGQPAVSAYFPGSSPLTDEKIAVLLAPPTTDHERFIKGLPDPVEV